MGTHWPHPPPWYYSWRKIDFKIKAPLAPLALFTENLVKGERFMRSEEKPEYWMACIMLYLN